ncbi:baseplate assembly protein [Xanthobacter sediminis]
MTRFAATTLDLSNLPAPQVVRDLDFEGILAARKIKLLSQFDSRGVPYDVTALETDSGVIQQENDAYREVLVRGAINDAARAVMLAFASGGDLDHLAAAVGIQRRLIASATSATQAVYESDAELRRRVQIAPEAFSTCGSEASYIHHALEAAPALIDAVPIISDTPSGRQVRVVCLDRNGDGVPSAATLAAVRARLKNKSIAPMTVPVAVSGPLVVPYAVALRLLIPDGPDPALVRAASRTAVGAMVAGRRGLGIDILAQAFEASGRVSGVERVVTLEPSDMVIAPDAVANCLDITITTEILNG